MENKHYFSRLANTESFTNQIERVFSPKQSLQVGSNHIFDITIQVTEDCNLACTYCYQHNKSPKVLKFEDAKNFIDLLLANDERTSNYIKSRECAGAVLNFIGGEPLLELDLVEQITDYFINKMIELNHPWLTRFRIAVGTNGTLIDNPKVIEFLKKHQGHLSLAITIDGNKQLHDMCRLDKFGKGSYDRAFNGARIWTELSGHISPSKMTISPENVGFIGQAVIDILNEYHTKDVFINCAYEKGWETSHAAELYKQLKFVADYLLDNDLYDEIFVSILDQPIGDKDETDTCHCGGNGLMLALDASGDIYPCIRYTPSSNGPDVKLYKIGNASTGIGVTEEDLNRIKCLSCVTRQSQFEGTKCKDCPISKGCGDCPGYSYEVFGEVGKRTDFICEMHIARVLAHFYYWSKINQSLEFKNDLTLNVPRDWAIPIIGEEEYEMLLSLK